MGAVTAMPYFGKYFPGAADFTAGTGLIFSMYTVGQIIGGLVSGTRQSHALAELSRC